MAKSMFPTDHVNTNLEDHLKEITADVVHLEPAPPIPQVPATLPEAVLKFTEAFKNRQETTARMCLRMADVLDDLSRNLRQRASILDNQGTQIPEDLKRSVEYERECFSLAELLSVVEDANK